MGKRKPTTCKELEEPIPSLDETEDWVLLVGKYFYQSGFQQRRLIFAGRTREDSGWHHIIIRGSLMAVTKPAVATIPA
jgi:hypothetical protein